MWPKNSRCPRCGGNLLRTEEDGDVQFTCLQCARVWSVQQLEASVGKQTGDEVALSH